jgi:hypothetical protein
LLDASLKFAAALTRERIIISSILKFRAPSLM